MAPDRAEKLPASTSLPWTNQGRSPEADQPSLNRFPVSKSSVKLMARKLAVNWMLELTTSDNGLAVARKLPVQLANSKNGSGVAFRTTVELLTTSPEGPVTWPLPALPIVRVKRGPGVKLYPRETTPEAPSKPSTAI